MLNVLILSLWASFATAGDLQLEVKAGLRPYKLFMSSTYLKFSDPHGDFVLNKGKCGKKIIEEVRGYIDWSKKFNLDLGAPISGTFKGKKFSVGRGSQFGRALTSIPRRIEDIKIRVAVECP